MHTNGFIGVHGGFLEWGIAWQHAPWSPIHPVSFMASFHKTGHPGHFPDTLSGHTFRNGSWTNRMYNIGSNHRRPLDKDTCDLQMPM